MAHLHLPSQHSARDLELAGSLAELLDSEDLYVAWSVESGPAAPVVPAAVRDSSAAPSPALAPVRRRRKRQSLVVVLLDALVARRSRAI